MSASDFLFFAAVFKSVWYRIWGLRQVRLGFDGCGVRVPGLSSNGWGCSTGEQIMRKASPYIRGLSGGGCCSWVLLLWAICLSGCSGDGSGISQNALDTMQKAHIDIKEYTFEVWLATTPAEQERGLMQVSADQLAPIAPDSGNGLPDGAQRGMLFVFKDDRLRSFWMFNTITALDIAYIRSDGTIVTTHTMAPLETKLYPSIEPVRFALEVRAGLWDELGICSGDHVEIPESLLKGDN